MLIFHFRFVPYNAIALWPFIFVKEKIDKANGILIHHERIHLRQQIEMLLLPFYIVYVSHYLFNLLRYHNHDKAYREIIFEREAYTMESDMNYLNKRSMWNWMKF